MKSSAQLEAMDILILQSKKDCSDQFCKNLLAQGLESCESKEDEIDEHEEATPISRAILFDRGELAEKLIQSAINENLDLKTVLGPSLAVAAFKLNFAFVNYLVKLGADVNVKWQGWSALQLLCCKVDNVHCELLPYFIKTVRNLLNAGANYEEKDKNGLTPWEALNRPSSLMLDDEYPKAKKKIQLFMQQLTFFKQFRAPCIREALDQHGIFAQLSNIVNEYARGIDSPRPNSPKPMSQ